MQDSYLKREPGCHAQRGRVKQLSATLHGPTTTLRASTGAQMPVQGYWVTSRASSHPALPDGRNEHRRVTREAPAAGSKSFTRL